MLECSHRVLKKIRKGFIPLPQWTLISASTSVAFENISSIREHSSQLLTNVTLIWCIGTYISSQLNEAQSAIRTHCIRHYLMKSNVFPHLMIWHQPESSPTTKYALMHFFISGLWQKTCVSLPILAEVKSPFWLRLTFLKPWEWSCAILRSKE